MTPSFKPALALCAALSLSACGTYDDRPHYDIALHMVVAPVLPPPVGGAAHTRVEASQDVSPFRFRDTLGPSFTPENLPILTAFLQRVQQDEADIVAEMRTHYTQSRPYVVTQPAYRMTEPTQPIAYPNRHITFIYTTASLLVQMVPEKKRELFERAAAYSRTRSLVGSASASDIEAGKLAGITIASNFMQDAEFRHDFELAQIELRTALRAK